MVIINARKYTGRQLLGARKPNPPLNHAKLAKNNPFPTERNVWNCQKDVSWEINFTVTSWRARIKIPKSKRITATSGRSPVGDWIIANNCCFINVPNCKISSLSALMLACQHGLRQVHSPIIQQSDHQIVMLIFLALLQTRLIIWRKAETLTKQLPKILIIVWSLITSPLICGWEIISVSVNTKLQKKDVEN